MRRYDLVSGILLILSIVDFALAAPVSAQEKHQENADVVHVPTEDVINVLGKRWEEDLEKLGEEFLKTGGKLVESSSSVPSGVDDHGWTNVVQPPAAPNPAPSATNLDPSKDPSRSGCSWKRSPWARGSCWSALMDPESWLGPNLDDEGVNENGEEMKLNLRPQYHPVGPGGFGMGYGLTTPLLPQRIPKPDPKPLKDPDDDFDWDSWLNAPDPPPRSPPKEFGAAHWSKVDPAHPPSTSGYGPSPPLSMPEENEAVTPPSAAPDLEPQKEPESEVLNEAPPRLDPELHLDPQSLSTDSQLADDADLQAARYAAKGKAKESRRIHGTARDVGNAVQRELQPAERSLDSRE